MQKVHVIYRNSVCAKIAHTGQHVPKWNKLNYPEFPNSSKLIAVSQPKEKEMMIKLITNLLA